jgi:glycerophosphoryl diester phosphodiesterase
MPSPRPASNVRFERVAHRGSPKERTENTLPGFLLAIDHGADAVELDVHATKDGEVVVHHDEAVQRMVIAQSAWRDLSRIDLGDGDRIPRLRDVLEAIGDRAAVYIELKGRGI